MHRFESEILREVCDTFHRLFLAEHRVILSGGHPEPFYRAPTEESPGEIQFRSDYLNSCLHEIAHWLVAGPERRKLDDFGYWYAPDGRNAIEQAAFFRSEVKPQAIEWALAEACGVKFSLSVDNLNAAAVNPEDLEAFDSAVRHQKKMWETQGFPKRTRDLLAALRETRSTRRPESIATQVPARQWESMS